MSRFIESIGVCVHGWTKRLDKDNLMPGINVAFSSVIENIVRAGNTPDQP